MIWIALLLAAERTPLGIYAGWGAFREGDPPRCFAIATPAGGRTGGTRPFASVVARFGADRRSALFVRLSASRRRGAPVTLSIGERRFPLAAGDTAAWSRDAATDRAIVAAMRGARSMSVATVAASGRPFADTYALRGAASAIDAAALGCTA